MNRPVHYAIKICKKRLLPLTLIFAMLLSSALPAMAAAEQPADVQNGGFESGNLNGWTVLTPGWDTGAGVVNARSYGDCELPTNQSGNYHLSGLSNGIPASEGWELQSSDFLLSGSGWISVKMGGKAAAVKVYLSDGTQVGYFRQNRYNDVNYPYLSAGGSWNDMATYLMDLSGYLGKEMYVVLCDEVIDGSDAYACFDDVITCYDVPPDPTFRFDTVTDGHEALGAAAEVQIPWVKSYNLLRYYSEYEVRNGGFESGDLTDWTVLTDGFDAAGAVVNERTYWTQELPYNQSGNYHLNGWGAGIPEAEGWAVRSSGFVLGGSGYISVKMGGNAAVTRAFLSDGTEVGCYRNFRFRDASFPYISEGGAWCDMATYVIDLSDYLGREMYLELCDEVITDGWANAFFDDVITYYETAPDVSGRYDSVPDGHQPGESAKLAQIPWVLIPKASAEAARQIPNGDFETGDLSGWTIFGSGFPIRNGLPAANSDSTYWEQELPYSKSGNYFMNGWALSGNEANTWRIRSAPFTLEGSGWISVKMGGHAAAVRVYRLDGTLVGDFDQSRFCDREFPYLSEGGSWCEMANYLLDLSPNLGEVLYIELCDIPINGGWANAFFDDVVTYYPAKPVAESSALTGWVKDGHKPGEKSVRTVRIPAVIGSNNLYNPRNGGFEMGNLTGWTVESSDYFRESTAVVAVKEYDLDWKDDNDNLLDIRRLPYNQVGNYILSGHDANPDDEPATWKLHSSPFTLAGSGYVSVKMGGHSAAFEVRTAEDGKTIAYCQQRRFNDVDFPYLSKGGSWRDMATYVMDLSEFLGQKLVFVLMDEEVETPPGWANAYFDEVIAYYPQKPTTRFDTVTDGFNLFSDTPKEIEIPWIYLDVYDDVIGRFPLETTALKDISSAMTPQKNLNLYEYFKQEQGLTDQDLDGNTLSITSVTYYDSYGFSSRMTANPADISISRPGCYVVQYEYEQAWQKQTGRFDIVIPPSKPGNMILNGGFETGTLAGWTPLTDGFNAGTAVISAQSYWEQNLPYNQSGKYHLDGWNTGIDEGGAWAVRSIGFILEGSGYISAKMGGHAAAVKVYQADGTLIGYYKQTRFNDANFPSLAKGGSWADMGTYVMDLSAYLGQELYIELCDETVDGGWANAYFDDVVTYYDTVPDYEHLADTVADGGTGADVDIPWQLAVSETTGSTLGSTPEFIGDTAAIDTISNAVIAEAVADAGGELVTLNLDARSPSGTTTALNISAETAGRIAQTRGVSALAIQLGSGEMTFNTTALEAVAGEPGDTLSLSLKEVSTDSLTDAQQTALSAETESIVLDVSITSGGKPISNLGNGSLTVSVPFTPAVGSAGSYKLYHLTDAGDLEPVEDAVFSDGKVTFTIKHLSVWVALYQPSGQIPNGGFETGDLTGWTHSFAQNPVISATSYWGEALPYNQSGNYHLDGWETGVAEGDTWTVRSSTFELAGSGFISVKMGGHAAAVKVYQADGTLIGYYQQTRFNDAHFPHLAEGGSWADMGTYVMDLRLYLGQELYLELCDETVDGWAQAFFDEVVTYYETAPDYAQLTDTVADGGTGNPVNIPWQLAENLVASPNQIENGGFETGDLTGWTHSFAQNPVISATSYWGEALPYNQSGNYHLDGWETGVAEGDTWTVRSSTFELAGSGFISVKMGGHAAAVKVYQADGTLIGYYRQTRFNNAHFPHLAEGGSWADMGTYVMNLRPYLGQELYIELCDEAVDGWAQAFFDEVVTYYETAPDYAQQADTVADGGTGNPVNIPWQLAVNLADPTLQGIDPAALMEATPEMRDAGSEDGNGSEKSNEPEETPDTEEPSDVAQQHLKGRR